MYFQMDAKNTSVKTVAEKLNNHKWRMGLGAAECWQRDASHTLKVLDLYTRSHHTVNLLLITYGNLFGGRSCEQVVCCQNVNIFFLFFPLSIVCFHKMTWRLQVVNSSKLNYLHTLLFPGDRQSGAGDLCLGKFWLYLLGNVPISVSVSISKLLVLFAWDFWVVWTAVLDPVRKPLYLF